jgi:hypothetical protein
MTTTTRKPRIALMGEFSAGKSTLSNLLLGARPLPEKVTATRLSPVWMSHGTDSPFRVDVSGRKEAITLDQLGSIPVEETRVIRLFFEADILDVCDLIDFPGISDPNMSSDVWQRMLEEVDAVLWCTHATQAWRQSEAAVWESMPDAVRQRSALLITRFDKLTTERDRFRVLKRLEKETEGLFAATFPISLTNALAAGDDYEAFEESGGIDFLQYFLQMIDDLAALVAHTDETLYVSSLTQKEQGAPAENTETQQAGMADDEATEATVAEAQETAPEPDQNRVLPRRVQAQGNDGRRARPRSHSKAVDMTEAEMQAQSAPPRRSAVSELRDIFHSNQTPAE